MRQSLICQSNLHFDSSVFWDSFATAFWVLGSGRWTPGRPRWFHQSSDASPTRFLCSCACASGTLESSAYRCSKDCILLHLTNIINSLLLPWFIIIGWFSNCRISSSSFFRSKFFLSYFSLSKSWTTKVFQFFRY